MITELLKLGIDIGSTTAKVVLLDNNNNILHTEYTRHNTEVFPTLIKMLSRALEKVGNVPVSAAITGTAGMGVSEKAGLLFTQEVVASAEVVKKLYPDVRTLIDLGGEDAKIIFFNEDMKPDIRMNGNCAGGTGAFIDQMASLLNIDITEVNDLASKHTNVYPIASRCGVFAKTDVQNLISRDIPSADIAASIYRAVAFQTVNSLARGFDITPKIIFAGGPLTFQPMLQEAFKDILKIGDDQIFRPEHPAMLPAIGAAILDEEGRTELPLVELISHLKEKENVKVEFSGRLDPLFKDEKEFESWYKRKNLHDVDEVSFESLDGQDVFLGIDSGSTTTKIVLINSEGKIAFRYYNNNNGNPIEAVLLGLKKLRAQIKESKININIARTSVTGYGEDLIHFAFSLDEGIVETIAHYKAASFFDPEVSFILDIGGQDMKAIFIQDGVINNLELNESCSSGSGSFIEAFAKSLGISVQDFSTDACKSLAPCDLGTRCTVFMNSKVKQALREGATIGDISAGLAFSVIKNCFNKVLKITDNESLGDHIVVQGGTFKNPAVLKALETLLEKEVVRPNISELMGAYGAALVAKAHYLEKAETTTFIGIDNIEKSTDYTRKSLNCKGCENQCMVTRLTFDGEKSFYTGNKCEKIFTNQLKGSRKGLNLHEKKRELLFNRNMKPEGKPRMVIGIPRALNMYDNFPFWNTLLVESGFEVRLSGQSTMPLAEKGYGTVMSENICFPAKITNGHIMDLIESGVDRIFYPMVRYEREEYGEAAVNQYNCPVVTGYPQVIESSINPQGKHNIPFDNIPIAFNDFNLLQKACREYLEKLGVDEKIFAKAFAKAVEEQNKYKLNVTKEASKIIESSRKNGNLLIMLIGRPYHVDPLVNHKIPEMISAMGIDLITEDSLPMEERSELPNVKVLTQWAFPNRVYDAVIWAGEQKNVEVVQLNSFGCGPDAIAVDEVKPLLQQFGKNPTVLRIDEITSPGSVKLRIRSMIESILMKGEDFNNKIVERKDTPPFMKGDKKRLIIAPEFAPFYTKFLIAGFKNSGFDIEILPAPVRESVEVGLRYTNNDICYPATIVIGDLIRALQSGRYDLDNIAVAISQTGGQCRASSYISLLKKGMLNAGFDNIPVVSVSATVGKNPINYQPGFQVGTSKFTISALMGILLGDVLSKMYYNTAVREKNKGEAAALVEKYTELGANSLGISSLWSVFKIMEQAVAEFNQIEVDPTPLPKVGIVGEIYVKFNPFANNYINDWLMERNVEVDVPPLIDFFLQKLVTDEYNAERNIEKASRRYLRVLAAGEKIINNFIFKANRILEGYKGDITPIHTVRHIAEGAEKILSLINQYGESWLLAGDISGFVESGIYDVVCLQPFGCIANHVIAKGIEKKLKDLYPHLNMLFLDCDSGISEVNSANRLEFLIKGAKETFYKQEKDTRDEDKQTQKEEEKVNV